MEKSPDKESAGGGIRLQVWLARSGAGSRRRCEELIEAGRIAVNGKKVTRMGTKVSQGDAVTMDGRVLVPEAKTVTLAVHKPKGYLCAGSDADGRPLVSDLFRLAVSQRLFHVGRLDYMSTGLILYTNDGELARRIGHPSSGFEKEYLVETAEPIEPGFLEEYSRGIWTGGTMYRCARYSLKNPRAAVVVLREGKNREIRNVFMSRRLKVKRVHRLRIGKITLRGLDPGHFRRLTEREVAWFMTHATVKSQGPRDARQGPRDRERVRKPAPAGPPPTGRMREARKVPAWKKPGGPGAGKRDGNGPGRKPAGGGRRWK